jgi:bifunctional non-homologous end joining protein LigD
VHEHHARRPHWDLRLEHDGVLMSWAVPNGIPQDPRENRKAIHVEDHPLSYIDFEGEIPQGSYGAGRVLIWDSGLYECEKLREDELIVVFHGERLRGRYALFRTGEQRDWMIHRMDPPEQPRDAMPEHLAPMLASAGALPPDQERWGFEVKWDGVRAILYWRPGRLLIENRNLRDITARYPELRALGNRLGSLEVILDGEIFAYDERGRPSFERLQRRMHVTSDSVVRRLREEIPVSFAIFDLLHLDGRSTRALPYLERRALLEQLDLNGAAWQTPPFHAGSGSELLAASAEHGLEGVVAKRLDSPYLPGRRSEQWVKVKNVNRQELVIGGWLTGTGRRSLSFGALLVGYHQDGELRYAGRVGTGFDESELERLTAELRSRSRVSTPFSAHGTQPPRGAHFVEPEMVAEVEFSDWTSEQILRHSVYKGLRSDKPAEQVVKEHAQGLHEHAQRPCEHAHQPYEVLRESKRHTEIQVEARKLRLSNREKVMYPSTGFTKGQLVDYYADVAPVLLGHLMRRPLTLKRYPDGVDGEFFYEKRCPSHRPEWVTTAAVRSDRLDEKIDYCVVEDLPTLIWVANLAGIELHPSLSRAQDIEAPTSLVFDLDPGAPAGLKECARVALQIRELFDTLGLQCLAKSSGSKGMQVYVPLNTPVTYGQTKPFARAVAELLEKQHPKLVLSRMSKSLRGGKVLIDWSQNDPHKTTVCVYSLRARERPAVSTPLMWEEVEQASRWRRERELSLEPAALLARVEQHGDLFAPLNELVQGLPTLDGA